MTIKNWHDRLETTMSAAARITKYHLLPANHQVAPNSIRERERESSVHFQERTMDGTSYSFPLTLYLLTTYSTTFD